MSQKHKQFEKLFLPHLDAAYGLARWISNDSTLADDIVQAAYVRAWEHFERYEHRNSSGWLLTIVRNVAYTMLAKRNKENKLVSFDEVVHHGLGGDSAAASDNADTWRGIGSSPEFNVEQLTSGEHIEKAMTYLSAELREVIVLREVEGYSYREIAEIIDVPKGTVMSRLSRGRAQLAKRLAAVTGRTANTRGSV